MNDLEKIEAIAAKIKRIAEGADPRKTLQAPETSQDVKNRADYERSLITDMAIRGGKVPQEYLPLNLEDESWLTQ